MTYQTADLYDKFGDKLQVAEPIFRDFGGAKRFSGPIQTLKIFEDNSLVRQAVETSSPGSVLVVDGGGSLRCALLGDQLAQLAVKNKWAGIVVYGCVRDSAVLAELPLGVKALATNPIKSVKRGEGQTNIPVRFAGVDFRPGEFLYADEDGIVLAEEAVN